MIFNPYWWSYVHMYASHLLTDFPSLSALVHLLKMYSQFYIAFWRHSEYTIHLCLFLIMNLKLKIFIYFLPFVILTTFMKIIRGFCFEMYKPEVQLNSGFTPLWTIVVRREIYNVLSQVYFTQNMFLVTTTYLRRVFTHVCI